jgi:hypothetical protein
VGVSKEKVKAAYKRDLVSLEILKVNKTIDTVEEAEKFYDERVQHKIYLVDDLAEPYLIRMSYTEKKQEIRSVDPDLIEEGDRYELSETIQDILKENLFPIIKSNFPQKEDDE